MSHQEEHLAKYSNKVTPTGGHVQILKQGSAQHHVNRLSSISLVNRLTDDTKNCIKADSETVTVKQQTVKPADSDRTVLPVD